MNEKDAWVNFALTGSVADYLKYTKAKQNGERRNEDSDGRDSDPRTEHQGGRQDTDRSDKG